jgi:hypothetical protein
VSHRSFWGKVRRYIGRTVFLPHRVSEILDGVEAKLSARPTVTPAATPSVPLGEWYPGYTQPDLAVFDSFRHAAPQAAPGFVTNFIGVRTRTSSLWNDAKALDGQVQGRPGRFQLMVQHFKDNGPEPANHRLLCAAVGAEAGKARWPRICDPANAAGARPVRYTHVRGSVIDAADAAYMSGAMNDFVEVEILPFDTLLNYEQAWDPPPYGRPRLGGCAFAKHDKDAHRAGALADSRHSFP